MLVRALACSLTGRSTGIVMVANRSLGNPTDRDDNGGLRNRMCNGSRIAVLPETAGYTTEPYRACAPHFYPNHTLQRIGRSGIFALLTPTAFTGSTTASDSRARS